MFDRFQDPESEVGPENTTELQVGGYEWDRFPVDAVNNYLLLQFRFQKFV